MTHIAPPELLLSVDDAVRWEEALAVYDRITAGAAPHPRDLDSAPLLSRWQRGAMPALEPVLIGVVDGHPRLPGRRQVATSRLIALDAEQGWARTVSRWYRLSEERG